MPEFTVNPARLDPYKNFKFRVKWDGRYVAGISKVSPLRRTTEVLEFREGGGFNVTHKSPGLTKYDPIILERGLTQDLDFENWANLVYNFDGQVSLASFRKDITLELYNEAGQPVMAYKIFRCWVSEYVALPDLDSNANAIAIQHIKLENEGWERDPAVMEPKET